MNRNTIAVKLGVAALAIAAFGGATAASSKGPHRGGPEGGRHERGIHHAMSELDLSEDQKQQLADLREAQRASMGDQHEQMRAARKALDEAIHADNVDESAIRAAAKDLAEIEADMAVARARSFQNLKRILTSEQVAKLEELKSRRQDRMEEHGERRKLRRNVENPAAVPPESDSP